jgi:hypothetical protein
MAEVITLAEAKTHLRITDADHDAEIQTAITDADGVIRAYLNIANVPEWDAVTAPAPVKRSTLLWTAYLYENRGDASMDDYEKVWATIRSILAGWGRIPTLA